MTDAQNLTYHSEKKLKQHNSFRSRNQTIKRALELLDDGVLVNYCTASPGSKEWQAYQIQRMMALKKLKFKNLEYEKKLQEEEVGHPTGNVVGDSRSPQSEPIQQPDGPDLIRKAVQAVVPLEVTVAGIPTILKKGPKSDLRATVPSSKDANVKWKEPIADTRLVSTGVTKPNPDKMNVKVALSRSKTVRKGRLKVVSTAVSKSKTNQLRAEGAIGINPGVKLMKMNYEQMYESEQSSTAAAGTTGNQHTVPYKLPSDFPPRKGTKAHLESNKTREYLSKVLTILSPVKTGAFDIPPTSFPIKYSLDNRVEPEFEESLSNGVILDDTNNNPQSENLKPEDRSSIPLTLKRVDDFNHTDLTTRHCEKTARGINIEKPNGGVKNMTELLASPDLSPLLAPAPGGGSAEVIQATSCGSGDSVTNTTAFTANGEESKNQVENADTFNQKGVIEEQFEGQVNNKTTLGREADEKFSSPSSPSMQPQPKKFSLLRENMTFEYGALEEILLRVKPPELPELEVCNVLPGTPAWQQYWMDFNQKIGEYYKSVETYSKQMDELLVDEDGKSYTDALRRRELDENALKLSMGLVIPKPPLIREPLKDTFQIGGYVIRALGGAVPGAFVTTYDHSAFRLEVQLGKLDTELDSISIDTKFNAMTITIPCGNNNAFKKLIQITVPPYKKVQNLDIGNPLYNGGKIVVTGK